MLGISRGTPLESLDSHSEWPDPTKEQSPGTYRSHPAPLSSSCAITTCGQGNRRRRCGGCRLPGAFGASSPGLRYRDPTRLPEGLDSARPPRGGAHARGWGSRVTEASRAPVSVSPAREPLAPPRRQPPPVFCSPAALAAVAGSGSVSRERPGREGGREAARRAGATGKAERDAALLCQAAHPGPVWPGPARGLQYPEFRGASGRKETCLLRLGFAPASGPSL